MKLRTVGKLLITFGVAVVLHALNMPVSIGNSDVINLHLMNERQNTLIIGGLIFIAGIVLFATFKIKQTKEETDIESAESLERRQLLKARLAQIGTSTQVRVKQVRQAWTARRVTVAAVAAVVLLMLAAGVFKLVEQDLLDFENRQAVAAALEYESKRLNVAADWDTVFRERDRIAAAERLSKEQVKVD